MRPSRKGVLLIEDYELNYYYAWLWTYVIDDALIVILCYIV